MLKPIPSKILKQSALLYVCSSVDLYQNATYDTYNLSRICIQPENNTTIARDNTANTLKATLFFDARLSKISPQGNIERLKTESEENGHPMQVVFNDYTYTVLTLDTLYDDESIYHHSELGLV